MEQDAAEDTRRLHRRRFEAGNFHLHENTFGSAKKTVHAQRACLQQILLTGKHAELSSTDSTLPTILSGPVPDSNHTIVVHGSDSLSIKTVWPINKGKLDG